MRCFIWDVQNVIQDLRQHLRNVQNVVRALVFVIIVKVFGKVMHVQAARQILQTGPGCKF